MAADCKSAALRSYGGSNPPLCTMIFLRADVAQLVEHSLGKGEVTSSILVISSRVLRDDLAQLVEHSLGKRCGSEA
jgi:hypothetical protein